MSFEESPKPVDSGESLNDNSSLSLEGLLLPEEALKHMNLNKDSTEISTLEEVRELYNFALNRYNVLAAQFMVDSTPTTVNLDGKVIVDHGANQKRNEQLRIYRNLIELLKDWFIKQGVDI